MPRQGFIGFRQYAEKDLADTEELALAAIGVKYKIVDRTEFHFAAVLIDAGKHLREEGRKNIALESLREVMGDDQPLLQRNDRAFHGGKCREYGGNEIRRRPIRF